MKAKAGAKAKPGAIGTKPVKVRKGGGKGAVLSGGNPRIAKGDGDAPVQAYIAGMPGWKRDIGKRLDPRAAQAGPFTRENADDRGAETAQDAGNEEPGPFQVLARDDDEVPKGPRCLAPAPFMLARQAWKRLQMD